MLGWARGEALHDVTSDCCAMPRLALTCATSSANDAMICAMATACSLAASETPSLWLATSVADWSTPLSQARCVTS
jgi:hypothetical protein